MKRREIPLIMLMVSLIGTTTQAQQTQQAPQQREGAATGQTAPGDVLNLLGLIGGLQQQPGQRGGGGRGGAPANPPTQVNPNAAGVDADYFNGKKIRRIQIVPDGTVTPFGQGAAWWTNTAMLTRLGLTDDQKLKIERVYESHRQNLVSTKDALEKEEAQLSRLLGAEPLDRTASIAQIYKVVQARGEMEKTNSLMTFEMREVLTRAQWTQLQAVQPPVIVNPGPAPTIGGLGIRGGGGGGTPTPFGVAPAGTPAPGTGGQRSGRGQ